MIPLAGVITALKGSGSPFKVVGGAADLVTAGSDLKTFPSAYVLPLQDGADPNRYGANAVGQMLTERFGVMYAIRNLRAGAGDKAQEELRVSIDWARVQLLGLKIVDGLVERDLVQFEGGDFVSFDNEILIWNDRYFTTRDLRKV